MLTLISIDMEDLDPDVTYLPPYRVKIRLESEDDHPWVLDLQPTEDTILQLQAANLEDLAQLGQAIVEAVNARQVAAMQRHLGESAPEQ